MRLWLLTQRPTEYYENAFILTWVQWCVTEAVLYNSNIIMKDLIDTNKQTNLKCKRKITEAKQLYKRSYHIQAILGFLWK